MCSNWNTCARNTQYLACVRECLHSDAAYQLKQFRKWQWSSQRRWHFPNGHFSGGVYLSFGNLPEEEKKNHQLVELRIQIRSATFLPLFLISFCFFSLALSFSSVWPLFRCCRFLSGRHLLLLAGHPDPQELKKCLGRIPPLRTKTLAHQLSNVPPKDQRRAGETH